MKFTAAFVLAYIKHVSGNADLADELGWWTPKYSRSLVDLPDEHTLTGQMPIATPEDRFSMRALQVKPWEKGPINFRSLSVSQLDELQAMVTSARQLQFGPPEDPSLPMESQQRQPWEKGPLNFRSLSVSQLDELKGMVTSARQLQFGPPEDPSLPIESQQRQPWEKGPLNFRSLSVSQLDELKGMVT